MDNIDTCSKIIIHNNTNLNDLDILELVISVIKNGMISQTKKGYQYCFVTIIDKYVIICDKRYNGYTFTVKEDNNEND